MQNSATKKKLRAGNKKSILEKIQANAAKEI